MPPMCQTEDEQPSASSLIVVSNRLPFVLKKKEDGTLYRAPSAGGLVTAVAPVMVRSGGLWIGWPGTYLDENVKVPESDPDDVSPTAGLKSRQICPVNLDKEDYEAYYNGCCNGTFWPLFHSMPDRAVFDINYWTAYKRVNENFSDAVLKSLRQINKDKPDQVPIVWIHDYHLMLAANTIRQVADEENLQCKLGFFLHIPFPPWDIVKILPWHDMILQGILACDLVGFHTNDYCVNFIDCCQRGLGSRVDRRAMLCEHGGRSVRIRALPIGIPYKHFEALANSAPPNSISNESIRIILGVDRLDYTKGIKKRFLAYKKLLENNPKYIEKVLFLQIAVPSRTDVKEYQDLKEEIDKLVGMINGKFSTSKWSPVRYIYGQINQIELAGFYRDADIAFVTPLRDGMNLVAKEFVACRVAKPGVLILSPFAGAGEMMHEAIRVNPYEIDSVAKELDRALSMPDDEREVRMNALRAREKVTDVDFWMKRFLTNIGTLIQEDGEEVLPTKMQPLSIEDFNSYLAPYVGDRALLALLLDYDGTLAPIAPTPAMAKIPTETKRVLERLSNHPDVFIAVISGRSVDDVKSMVGIEGITYAGNHGLDILHNDGSKFVHPMPAEHQERLARMLKQLHEEVCQHGAWVENKGVLLTYHYVKFHWRKGMN
uniref:Trehalose-6-phosphate synthase n=1 Tax=Clytia hemisphaerica TaxID=252671 RepID=A0A7M5XCU2_9CNID